MASVSLQFQGVQDPTLPLVLLTAVVVVLAGWGIGQLVARRRRYGLLCLAAAGGPAVFVPGMLVDAALRYGRGDGRGGSASVVAAMAAAVGTAVAGLVALAAGGVWPAVLATWIALAVGVFYSRVYGHLGRRRLAALMVLRCAAILALMLMLFKPAMLIRRGGPGDRPYLPILVDRSGSMATADEVNLPDRYRQSVQMLLAQSDRIERHFTPLWYHFASSAWPAESAASLGELSPSGEGTDATDLAAAIRSASADYARASLAGIVVLTDGIHNASGVVTDAAIEAGVPVYAVAVGSTGESLSARRNVELSAVDAPLEAVVNNVTTLAVEAKVSGFATVPLEVRLFEQGRDEPADTQRLWTDRNVATLKAELKWTPRSGPEGGQDGQVRRLRVEIPSNPAEATPADNATEVHVLLTEPRVRVLYVEGSMRPEYKYLKRLLSSDPNIRFMALVRITGNRFWAQGGIGGRQLSKLPETDSEFAMFDVIILGDLDRTFLSKEQMARFRSWVNDGGGLLMLGGHNSFGPGGYGGTDIEAALPVTVGSRGQAQETTPLVPRLTAAGEAHAIFQGMAGFFHGPGGRKPDAKLPELPELLGCVTVPGVKPAASLLAIHPTRQVGGGPMCVLAVQRFGAGRSAAFTADTTWKWYLPLRGMGRDSPYERFWGQLIRWLANVETKSREAKPSVVIRPARTHVRVGQEPVEVLARVQDEKGRPADNAQVSLTITPEGRSGEAETIPMSPRMGDRLYRAEFRPRREGTVRLEASALDSAGARLGSDAQDVQVVPFSKETDRLARNDGLLELLAERTDGRMVTISGLPDLVDQILQRRRAKGDVGDVDRAEVVRLYHFPLLFVAFIALVTGEWLLRRRWHLR